MSGPAATVNETVLSENRDGVLVVTLNRPGKKNAFDKPLVTAAQGVAVGGWATVLFHADIVYVGESLRLRLPFVSPGLVPEWASSYMLQANIGAQRAAELFWRLSWKSGRRIGVTDPEGRSWRTGRLAQ